MAHQCQQIVFRVAKRSQPEIVSSHISDKDWLLLDLNAALRKCGARLLNIIDLEIDDGARVIEFRFRRQRKHQPNPAAIEESEIRGHTEQMLHAKRIPVKRRRSFDVVRGNRDLFDRGKAETR